MPSMISKYDKIIVGIATAVVVAFVAYGLLIQAEEWLIGAYPSFTSFNERSIALMAIVFNILPMNYFQRRYYNKSLRGLVIGTMILAGAWFYVYGQDILNG